MKLTEQSNQGQTILEAINDFISHCRYEKNLNGKTITAYCIDLKQFSIFSEAQQKNLLPEADRELIKMYIRSISNYKPKTIKRKIASLKAMFNFIEFEREDYINPFRKIKVKIKEPLNLPVVMNIDELKRIIYLLYEEQKKQNI